MFILLVMRNTLFFLFFGIKLLKADISSLYLDEEGFVTSYPKQCADVLKVFAQSASNFTMCSIHYARPVKLCEKCIDDYLSFRDAYKALLDKNVNGTKCSSIFISRDRLDAVLKYYTNILTVWEKGNCKACFDWPNGKPKLSSQVEKFNKMLNETMECIQHANTFHNNSQLVCSHCMQAYVQLDNHYKTLSTDSIGVDVVCMDVVDSMNTSRSIWSKDLNCCKIRKSPEIIFLCCTVIISILPILFYVTMRYCGPIRDLPNILKQSRFKQSLLRSYNGRIN